MTVLPLLYLVQSPFIPSKHVPLHNSFSKLGQYRLVNLTSLFCCDMISYSWILRHVVSARCFKTFCGLRL